MSLHLSGRGAPLLSISFMTVFFSQLKRRSSRIAASSSSMPTSPVPSKSMYRTNRTTSFRFILSPHFFRPARSSSAVTPPSPEASILENRSMIRRQFFLM